MFLVQMHTDEMIQHLHALILQSPNIEVSLLVVSKAPFRNYQVESIQASP